LIYIKDFLVGETETEIDQHPFTEQVKLQVPPMISPHRAISDAHAVCTALRRARKNLCHRVELVGGADDGQFVQAFPTIVAEVEAAFRQEEFAMERFGFPYLRERIEDNAIILSALHRVTPGVEQGNLTLGREVVAALGDLLDLHRLTSDLALTLAIESQPDPAHDRLRGSTLPRSSRLH
jgi:hemerythrin